MLALVIAAVAAARLHSHRACIHWRPGGALHAPLSGETFAPDQPNSADRIISALLLGLASGRHHSSSPRTSAWRLPDRINIPLSVLALGLIMTGSVLGELPMWFTAFFAGLVALVFFIALHLLGRLLRARTMGLGDVKLAFIVFAVAGLFDLWAPALVLVVMMRIAGVWALVGAVRARRIRGVTIAFGPAMLSGMWLGCLFAPILL